MSEKTKEPLICLGPHRYLAIMFIHLYQAEVTLLDLFPVNFICFVIGLIPLLPFGVL